MDDKSKLIFYPDWYMVVSGLDDATRLKIYDELLAYKFNKTPPTMPIVKLMASQIDRDEETYQNICNRNKWNGAKGGRPKKPNGFEENPNNPVGFLETQENPNNPNEPKNKEKNKDKDNSSVSSTNVEDTPQKQVLSSDVKNEDGIDFNKFIEFYNNKARGLLPLCTKLTEKRKASIRARMAEYGKENLAKVVIKGCQSSFMIEHKFGLDWMMTPTYFPKILEGYYENRKVQNNGNTTNNHPQGVTRSEITNLVNQFLNETD